MSKAIYVTLTTVALVVPANTNVKQVAGHLEKSTVKLEWNNRQEFPDDSKKVVVDCQQYPLFGLPDYGEPDTGVVKIMPPYKDT